MTYPAMPLGDLVIPRPGTRNPATGGEATFKYVDLESVDREKKVISSPKVTICKNAPSRARKVIKADDVLVSLVRPNLNAVAMVPPELDNEIASTGFCVLRATERVLPLYVYFAVRSPTFINGLCGLVSGALYPAVTESQVLSQRIPVPPVEEQRRIVDLLSRAENIVRMRREAEAKAKEVIPALFLDMFGDPATNPKGWDIRPLGDILRSIDFGLSVALSKDVDFKPGRTGVLRIANITANGHLDLTDVRYIKVSDNHRTRLDLRAGDLLFNWRNSPKWVGKTAFVANGLEHTFASFLYRLRASPERADSHYVWRYLNLLRERGVFESMCRQAVSQANLGRDELASVRVMVAPLERQQSFGKWCVHLWGVEAQLARATWTAETAFQSLLAGVFGER